jgi:periplasmic protein TonB
MFNNLVESGSHGRELARKGRFMLGTLALYGVLLAASGVAGVVAYDARLGHQTLEITSMVAPVPVAQPQTEPAASITRPRSAGGSQNRAAIRTDIFADLRTTPRTPPPVSTARASAPPAPPGVPTVLGDRNFTPEGGIGPRGDGDAGHVARERAAAPVRVHVAGDPPPPSPAPAATPRPPEILRVTSSVISGKVLSKPVPPYPKIAIATRTQGPVSVEILIDEGGRVVSARASGGPAVLRAAAEQAARQARFTPTLLGGRPVKVSGVITYNFVLN